MALSVSQTLAVGRYLQPNHRVASMGYPDIIAPPKLVDEILHGKSESLAYRIDSAGICRRHGLKDRRIPDAESFFSLLGAHLDVYDIVKERGCEILCDLNQYWNLTRVLETYDIVLDVGTVEHCFNVAQAAFNMAGLVKVGGYIIHENPFNCGNHGFYGMQPTWYSDFYTANGFELLECRLVNKAGGSAEVPHTNRFKFIEQEVNVFAVARRVSVSRMVYPQQTKYRKASPAAVVSGEQAASARAIGE